MQSNIVQRIELPPDERNMFEEQQGFGDRHIQHVRDALPLMMNLHSLAVVPLTLTDLTGHVDVRQKMHLDLEQPVSLASLAAAAFHIETVAARLVPADTRVRQIGIEVADEPEQPCIGRRIRTRSPANRRLVDVDDFI
ncbi:MAG: hypothetical protein JW394_0228 [Nitrospira sp.]|nr:hypothetical protein [Nitrospira sp.]